MKLCPLKNGTQNSAQIKIKHHPMLSNHTPIRNNWYVVSSHGSVLFYIAVNPGCTIAEIAEDMALTKRTVWGLIGDLRRSHMLDVLREGRRHHYVVNLDAEFKHPVIR